MMSRDPEGGVVLVNVLVVLAIAGGLMLLLLSSQEAALDRVARAADAAVVEQIAMGAEASVVDALRRDLDDAPDSDHLNEPWALGVIQEEVVLPTGRFSVQITDVQGKFDINQLANPTPAVQDFILRLLTALDQPVEVGPRIARGLQAFGPISQLDDLAALGVPRETLDAFAPHVTALPVPGTINLNSAGPLLLSVMLKNDRAAARLREQRETTGFVTLQSLKQIDVLRPQNSGFTSDVFDVEIKAEAGAAQIHMVSRVLRSRGLAGKSVRVLSRYFVYDAPGPEADT